MVALVARVGEADLADEPRDRGRDGLAGGGVEIAALVAAAARITPGAELAAPEVVAAAQVLAGRIGEVVLAIAIHVGAAPDHLLDHGRRSRGRLDAQRGVGPLNATLQRGRAGRMRRGGRLGRQATSPGEQRNDQGRCAPDAAMGGHRSIRSRPHGHLTPRCGGFPAQIAPPRAPV